MQNDFQLNLKYIINRFLILLILIVYIWFITLGTWNLFKGERYGSAYDSLGQSLLSGNCNVDHYSIGGEGYGEDFLINGKYYMYFGPWSSILRIVLNSLFPSLYGNWSRISCLIASIFCLVGFILIINDQLSKNNFLNEKQRDFLYYLSVLGFGLGSPVVFLMSIGYDFSYLSVKYLPYQRYS